MVMERAFRLAYYDELHVKIEGDFTGTAIAERHMN